MTIRRTSALALAATLLATMPSLSASAIGLRGNDTQMIQSPANLLGGSGQSDSVPLGRDPVADAPSASSGQLPAVQRPGASASADQLPAVQRGTSLLPAVQRDADLACELTATGRIALVSDVSLEVGTTIKWEGGGREGYLRVAAPMAAGTIVTTEEQFESFLGRDPGPCAANVLGRRLLP